jgi:hypothetical protein
MKNILYSLTLIALLTLQINAQIINVNFSGSGTTSYSAWSNINSFNYTGYGSFPGNTPWPAPIRATDGSTNSTLNRVSGSPTGGGPFLATDSIYFGSFSQVTNTLGGTLRLSNSVSLTNIKTLVLQIQIGEAIGYDFFEPTGLPKLTLNSSTNLNLNATYTNLVNRFQNGTFPSPETGNDEPVWINTLAFQWNITNIGTIDNYAVDFSAVTHAQVYALRWDSTSALQNTPVIPEPSTLGLLVVAGVGFAGYILRKRKRI